MKYKTLIIFLIILICWSFLFSGIKFFIWQDLQTSIAPDLESIAWYLSLGSAFAYLIWWAISLVFLKRYLLFFFASLIAILLILTYFFPIHSSIYLSFIISFIGFLYGLWVVLRTIILSIEIEKTWISDTKLNAIANILFIIFLILGSILRSKINEILGHNWIWILIWILIFTAILSMFLDYEKFPVKTWIKSIVSKKYLIEKKESFSQAMKEFIPQIKYIALNWKWIILTSSILWAITTIVSQQAIQYSIKNFDVSASEWAYILLFSSVWAIFWNIISSFLSKYRWAVFLWSSILMSLLILWFLVFADSFLHVSILAAFLWFAFGMASNMIDSYFLVEIWKKDKKEYWSASYGFVLSVILFVFMILASWINHKFWFNVLIIILATGLFVSSILFYINQDNALQVNSE